MITSATTMETTTASAYEMAIGWNNAPDKPSTKKIGSKASKVISVAKKRAPRVPAEVSRMTLRTGLGSSSRLFLCSRCRIRSTSMMASSMTTPRATTNPAKTMALSVAPRW